MWLVPSGCNFLGLLLLGVCSDSQGSSPLRLHPGRPSQQPHPAHSSGLPSLHLALQSRGALLLQRLPGTRALNSPSPTSTPCLGSLLPEVGLDHVFHIVGIPDLCCSSRRKPGRSPRCLLWHLRSLAANPCALWTCEGGGRARRGDWQLCRRGHHAPLTLQPQASDRSSPPAARHPRPRPEGWGSVRGDSRAMQLFFGGCPQV
ncbi:hypothetical protein VULLAG_LOCUS18372 [Vulpes lagopus]